MTEKAFLVKFVHFFLTFVEKKHQTHIFIQNSPVKVDHTLEWEVPQYNVSLNWSQHTLKCFKDLSTVSFSRLRTWCMIWYRSCSIEVKSWTGGLWLWKRNWTPSSTVCSRCPLCFLKQLQSYKRISWTTWPVGSTSCHPPWALSVVQPLPGSSVQGPPHQRRHTVPRPYSVVSFIVCNIFSCWEGFSLTFTPFL